MSFTKHFFVLLFFINSGSTYSQDNVSNEMKKTEIIGSYLYNPASGNVYLVSSDCENQKLLRLDFDDKNWSYDTRNLGGNKMAQKMSLAILGKEKMKLVEKAEINVMSNLGSLMEKAFSFSNNPYEAITQNLNSQGVFYIDPRYTYTMLKEGEFVPTFDGNVKMVSDSKFSIYFKSHYKDEVVEIFSGDINEYNASIVTSIAYNQFDGNMAITVKKDGNYFTKYFNSKLKKYFPETNVTNYNFCRIGGDFKGLKAITSINFIDKIDAATKSIYLNSLEVSDLDKKGGFEAPKKPQIRIDTLVKFKRDLFEFYYNGGKYQFNDTLIALGNFENYIFTGYYGESGQLFNLTSFPYDPKMQSVDYLAEKFDFNGLIDICPNAPDVVREIEQLNNELVAIKKQGIVDNAKIKRFQFVLEETKDKEGVEITNIKILKDCKLYDLNDSSNRKALKDLVGEVRITRSKAIDDLSNTLTRFTTLSSKVLLLCKAADGIDAGGSKLLGAISKGMDKAGKGLLMAQLATTTSKATELFNSYKASKDQLDNAKKAIDNYKAITQ